LERAAGGAGRGWAVGGAGCAAKKIEDCRLAERLKQGLRVQTPVPPKKKKIVRI
jgi:hypothetical protein